MREIDRLKGNKSAIEAYRNGMNQIFNSGVIDALRALGRPVIVEGGKDVNAMATQAAMSAGWNQCIDALLYFEQVYLNDGIEQELPVMDFGAAERVVTNGLMTKEESHAIRQPDAIRYDVKQFTSNLPEPPKRPESTPNIS